MVIRVLRCIKCLYEWLPRTEKIPRCCPQCKSYGWKEIARAKPLPPSSKKPLTAESIDG